MIAGGQDISGKREKGQMVSNHHFSVCVCVLRTDVLYGIPEMSLSQEKSSSPSVFKANLLLAYARPITTEHFFEWQECQQAELLHKTTALGQEKTFHEVTDACPDSKMLEIHLTKRLHKSSGRQIVSKLGEFKIVFHWEGTDCQRWNSKTGHRGTHEKFWASKFSY